MLVEFWHNTPRLIKTVVLVALMACLHSCGYHLKGKNPQTDTSYTINTVDLSIPNHYSHLAIFIRNELISRNIEVQSGSDLTLELESEKLDKWQLSTSQSRTTHESTITITARFKAKTSNHSKAFSVSREAVFQDNADKLTSKDMEENQIVKELRKRIAQEAISQFLIISKSLLDCDCSNEN